MKSPDPWSWLFVLRAPKKQLATPPPNPVVRNGYGMGTVSVDRDQTNAHFLSVWGGLNGPATMGYFHTGLAS